MSRRAAWLGGVLVLVSITAAAGGAVPPGPRLAFQTLNRASRVTIQTAGPNGSGRQVLIDAMRHTKLPRPLPGFAPAWSPNGRRIVFAGREGGVLKLFAVPAGGGKARPIPGTDGAFDPVLSPGGHTVAFARARIRAHIGVPKGGPPVISSYTSVTTWTIGIDGRGAQRLTAWRNGLEITPSSFSPDGRVLAASQFDEDKLAYEAVALQTDGSGASVLAHDAYQPAFSPDGTEIALILHLAHLEPKAGRLGSYRGEVAVMNADGSGIRRLARTSFGEQSPPSWDPSGARLAYTQARSIVEMNADGSCRKRVFTETAKVSYYGPAWQPGTGREASRISC